VRFGNGFVFANTTIDFSCDIYPFTNPCMLVDFTRTSVSCYDSIGLPIKDETEEKEKGEEEEEDDEEQRELTRKTIFANIHSTSSKSDSTSCNSSAVWNVDMGIRVDLSDAIQLLISHLLPNSPKAQARIGSRPARKLRLLACPDLRLFKQHPQTSLPSSLNH
jgi:hypothetical protein